MKVWMWVLLFLFVAVVLYASASVPISPIALDARVSVLEEQNTHPIETVGDVLRRFEKRLEALEKTVKACCTSQSKPYGTDRDLEVVVTMRGELRREFRRLKELIEEIEWRNQQKK